MGKIFEVRKPIRTLKGWGMEELVVNELYCGKKMTLNEGKKCSDHFHIIKEETFLFYQGLVHMTLYPNSSLDWKNFNYTDEEIEKNHLLQDRLIESLGQKQELIMKPDDVLDIDLGLVHSFYGLEESVFFEFSTPDSPEDSHRIRKGN